MRRVTLFCVMALFLSEGAERFKCWFRMAVDFMCIAGSGGSGNWTSPTMLGFCLKILLSYRLRARDGKVRWSPGRPRWLDLAADPRPLLIQLPFLGGLDVVHARWLRRFPTRSSFAIAALSLEP